MTCAKPSFGDRREVWSATLTVAPLYLASRPDFLLGYGYNEGDAGSLSDTSFQFNSRTFTVTELASYIDSSIDLKIDQGIDNTIGLPTLESLHLHFCDTVLDLANPTGTEANKVLITYEAHVVGTSQSVPGALGFDPSFGGISCRIFRRFIARVALFRQ